MKKTTRNSLIILSVTLAMIAGIVALNMKIVFDVTSSQTETIGSIQMNSMSDRLENTFNDAERSVTSVAYEVDLKLSKGATQSDLETYFVEKKASMTQDGNCINVYAAGEDWYIIPDFQEQEGFVAQERPWYLGAVKNSGGIYITQPYMDLASDSVCFTVSRVLTDNKTVISLDFNLNKVQEYMKEMGNTGIALIVAESGEIAGYSDPAILGKNISEALPQYADIFDLEKNNQNAVTLTRTVDGKTQTVFCSKTENNWYLMLITENTQLYSDSYKQLVWISVITAVLLLAVLGLYGFSRRKEIKTERLLDQSNEAVKETRNKLASSIRRIINYSSPEYNDERIDKGESVRSIREMAVQMATTIDGMGTIDVKEIKEAQKKEKEVRIGSTNRNARKAIITVMFLAMCISVALVATSNISLGNEKMNEEADFYENELSSWVSEQKSILGMFCNTISADPTILDDYTGAVKFLNDITTEYEDISVTYMTNPDKVHTVIMNNGWQPDDDWHVEERQWYIDTLASKTGYSISAPYFDEQTGYYCVTFSQIVNDKSNNFLGIFGIDFYMDKLTKILGQSYTSTGYAFLVDGNGNIINHPNPFYEMNESTTKNVLGTEYTNCYVNKRTIDVISDYSGKLMACVSSKDEASGFTVVIVRQWWSMYGNIILYSLLFIAMFGGCIGAIYYLISKMILWQTQVNEQLKEAAEKATSAGKAKSNFLAQMSHEIRTPINAVLGMNELIMRESTDPTIRDYSNDIQSAGRTLLSLINSILDFSKIEDGKMEIVPVEYDSASLINDLVNMTSERSKSKNLELKLNIDPTIPATLFGDDVRLRQVIVNLLTNAVKYTEHGSVTLLMSVKEKVDNKIKLYVSVSDTGIGIKEEDRDKLCLSFSRLDQERNHSIEGTGLGLSIVTKLLSMMDTELQIESEYGKGSNFFFTIEQGIIKDDPIGDYSSKRNRAIESDKEKKVLYAPKADILAVDDNDMNLKVVRGLLKKNGIVPDIASSGMQCIEMAENKHYDIILLDHMMPVMDGIETLKQLKEKNIVSEDTIVIVLTANAIVGAKEMYLEAGFNDYLSKPIDAVKLEEKLMHYLPEDKLSKLEEPKNESEPTLAASEEVAEESLIDINTGLSYCANDMDMYIEVAQAYLEEGYSNIEKLDAYYGEQDWKNYSILAHAVKSTSRTIGAMSLGDLAYKHELAGKEGNAAEIDATYFEFLTLYQRVLDELSAKIKDLGNK